MSVMIHQESESTLGHLSELVETSEP